MIEWIEKYSFTDEPDEMGRWARMGVVNGVTICWISKAREKYLVMMHLPTRLSDSPHESSVFDTYNESKDYAYRKLIQFKVKFKCQ